MAGFFQRGADGADAPVHHVGRRDDVAAGLDLHQALLHQHLHRGVVMHIAVAQHAVMAVAGIGIERHIAQHADLRHRGLDGAHRAADQVVGIERLAAVLGLSVRRGVWGNSAITGMPSAAASFAAATTRSTDSRSTPGMEATGFALVLAFDDEHRPDEVGRRQACFPRPAVASSRGGAGGACAGRGSCS